MLQQVVGGVALMTASADRIFAMAHLPLPGPKRIRTFSIISNSCAGLSTVVRMGWGPHPVLSVVVRIGLVPRWVFNAVRMGLGP